MKKPLVWRLLAVVLLLLVLFFAAHWLGLREHFNHDFIRQRIEQNQVSGLLLFVLLFVLGNLVQIPGWVFLAAAVLALGQSMGGVVTYVAACTSCAVTFVLIRAIGGDALRQLEHPLAVKIMQKLASRPVFSVVLLRTLFQTMPAVNYALAMSGIPFRQYLLGTLLGLPLPIFLYCMFFDYLAKMLHL